MEVLLCKSEFAEAVGISRQYLYRLIKAGMPVYGRLIDREVAAAWILDRRTPGARADRLLDRLIYCRKCHLKIARRDLVGGFCLECVRLKKAALDEKAAPAGLKACRECLSVKPPEYFYSYTEKPSGIKRFQGECKACHAAKYSKAAGYVSPSAAAAKIESDRRHFVELGAAQASARICWKCGYIGPMREWPRGDRSDAHPGGFLRKFCKACDLMVLKSWPNARHRNDLSRMCLRCKATFAPWTDTIAVAKSYCRPCFRQNCRDARLKVKTKSGLLAAQYEKELVDYLRRLDQSVSKDCVRANGRFRKLFRLTNAEQARRKYWKNPEAARHKQRLKKNANPQNKYNFAGKRAARIASTADGTLTKGALIRLFDQATSCIYCEAPMRSTSEKSLDHFIPLKQGGRHSLANAVICCPACNFSKHCTHPVIWLGQEMFDRILAQLRKRCCGEPCPTESLAPIGQVEEHPRYRGALTARQPAELATA